MDAILEALASYGIAGIFLAVVGYYLENNGLAFILD